MRRLVVVGLAAALVGLAPLAATAAPPPGRARAQESGPPPTAPAVPDRGRRAGAPAQRAVNPAKLATVQEALDGIEIATADKMLQLAPERYGDFIQRLRNLQLVRRRRQEQRLRLLNELRRAVNQQPPADDTALEGPIRQLDEFERQTTQEVQTAYGQIDEVLTPRQRARFRLFEEQMDQRKIEILLRVLRPSAAGRGDQ